VKTFVLGITVCAALVAAPDEPAWHNPLKKTGYLKSPLVETSPFVLNDRLYLLESWQAFWDTPGAKPVHSGDDVVRVRDVENDTIVATPLHGHGFATAFVGDGRVYVFASEWELKDPPPHQARGVTMVSSADLVHWTEPRTALRAERDEHIFNTAVCHGPNGFVLLYETDDARWPAFTFKYCMSDDLVSWKLLPNALYGTDKYVGGPALYREGDWFYTLFLHDLGGKWETRVTRSKDLTKWQDAPPDRPFVTFDPTHTDPPLRPKGTRETNASDAELCYFKRKTIVYFTGSDQQVAGDLQRAEFTGTPRELLESFFK
jgi:alpha-L-fucosidase